jgi:long-chain fatty acid transport protein
MLCLVVGQLLSNFSKNKIMRTKRNQTTTVKCRNANSRTACGFWFIAITFLSLVISNAEGFRNPPPGTFDLGRAGGRIAQVDDSSAVQQNPANLVDVTNMEFQLTPSVVYIDVDYHGLSGDFAETKDPWKTLPNLFASIPSKNDKAAFGFGITVPYGLSMEWNQNSSAFTDPTSWRYSAPYFTALTTINFNPTVAVRLSDNISAGAGFDVMWSDLEFKQLLPGLPNLEAHAEGDGFGYGGNLGITWQATEHQRFAVTLRSPITVNYDGNVQFNNFPGNPSSHFNSQINFPTIVAVGYGLKITDTVRVETDFEWLQFSRFKNLPVNIGNNPLGVPSQNIPENWHDTFTAGFGGDWKFADHWVLRAGYQFYQSPVPDSTFSPTIPDADQNVITIGLGWKGRRSSLELAYGLDFYNTRNITTDQNPTFNGKYTFNVHLFSLAYSYSF